MPRPTTDRLARPQEGSLALARLSRWVAMADRRRLAASVAAITVGFLVASALGRANATVDALGTTRPALVATSRIEPGEALSEHNSAVMARPIGHLPNGVLASRPLDASAAATIVQGEPIVETRVVGRDLGSTLAHDERAVTIPTPLAPPPVRVGSVVDLIAIAPDDPPFGATAISLGTGRVIAIADEAITIATTEQRALAVASQLGSGAVELLITPFEAGRGSLGE